MHHGGAFRSYYEVYLSLIEEKSLGLKSELLLHDWNLV